MSLIPLADRLRSRITVTQSGCWEWSESVNEHGYGRMSFRGRVYRAHRLAAHEWLGLDLADIETKVCHKCDNPPCINPDHLYLGTQSSNVRDMVERGRASGGDRPHTHCKVGHELTGDNVQVSPSGKRRCRECAREANRIYRARRSVREPAYWRKTVRALDGGAS